MIGSDLTVAPSLPLCPPLWVEPTSISGLTIPGGSDVVGATHLGTQFDFGYVDNTTGHGLRPMHRTSGSSQLSNTLHQSGLKLSRG